MRDVLPRRCSLAAMVALTLVAAAPASHAQLAPRNDAKSSRDAVFMMMTTIHLAHVLRQRCADHFPDLEPHIREAYGHWQSADKSEIDLAKWRFAAEVKQDPRLPSQVAATVNTVYEREYVLHRSTDPHGEAAELRQRCAAYFDDLAGGVPRRVTPNVYRYLQGAR